MAPVNYPALWGTRRDDSLPSVSYAIIYIYALPFFTLLALNGNCTEIIIIILNMCTRRGHQKDFLHVVSYSDQNFREPSSFCALYSGCRQEVRAQLRLLEQW